MSANAYIIADAVLNLVEVGIRVQEIRGRLAEERAAGKSEDEVHLILRQWRLDAGAESAMELAKAKTEGR